MQISTNTTPALAGLSLATDKFGHDHAVVVLRMSYALDSRAQLQREPVPAPLVYADIHRGAPGQSSIAWESDFCRYKPLTDVIVCGYAIAPGATPVAELPVRLEVHGRSKDALVSGERRWVRAAGFARMSPPVAFTQIPLVWERSSGDATHNLVGVGRGEVLPNIEATNTRITSPHSRPRPHGFSWIGRTWQPRIAHAGTYDQRWREYVCPLLPENFDERYFQAAPEDQQFPHFRGGERIRCVHMAAQPVLEFSVPTEEHWVHFAFAGGLRSHQPVLDTVVLEPHLARMHLSWRCSTPLPKRLLELENIHVGERPTRDGPIGHRRGKPHFRNLGDYVRWRRAHARRSPA